MKNDKNVLITSFGSNTSIGVAKCLNSYFNIFGTDTNPFYECNGFEFADKIIQVPVFDNENYEKEIIKIIIENNIECVIPIHDKELFILAEIFEKNKLDCQIAVNTSNIVGICNNKIRINYLLKDFVKVPTVYSNTENIHFPVIIKDNEGVSSKDIIVIYSKEEFLLTSLSNKIIQEYISDGTEYTVDCYTSYINQTDFYYSARKRIETKSGMSVKSEIISLPKLGELCKLIHEKLNYKGVSNIQFIEKNGEYYFIEINPRFAGGGVLTYKSGYNFPLMTINELCFGRIERNLKLEIGNKMVRYYNETFFDEKNNFIRS